MKGLLEKIKNRIAMHEKGRLSKDVSYPQLYLNYFINIM